MDSYYCPKCGANFRAQSGFNPHVFENSLDSWTCWGCGESSYRFDTTSYHDASFTPKGSDESYYCPTCGSMLNAQDRFSVRVFEESYNSWTCRSCGRSCDRFSADTSPNLYYDYESNGENYTSSGYVSPFLYNLFYSMLDDHFKLDEDRQKMKREEELRQLEEERLLREQEEALRKQKEEEREIRKQKIIKFLKIVFFRKIEVPLSSSECIGRNYEEITETFKEAGFTRVRTSFIDDLWPETFSQENEVASISVNDAYSFDRHYKALIPSKVVIQYHTAHLEYVPYINKKARGIDYKTVFNEYKARGFTNIELVPLNDLRPRAKRKNERVESVSVNGAENYSAKVKIRIDSHIVIRYHSYR